jgi:electron transfer flavoprotein alpha subunit
MNWVDKEDDMETAIYDLMLETKTDSIIMPDVIYYENYMKDLGAAINRYQDVTDIKVNVISVHNVYNYEKNQTIPDGTGRPAITWVCVNGVWQYKPNDNSNDYRHGK